MYTQKSIEKVRDADLLAIVGYYVDLKKQGSSFAGLSPFVYEKTPSFHVSESKNIWKCFSSGKGGNSGISFVMESQKKTFPEALEDIASIIGITLEKETVNPKEKEKWSEKEVLLGLLSYTNQKFTKNFNSLFENHWARKHIKKLGYTDETLGTFQIGYASKEFNELYEIFKEKGKVNEAKDLGLLKTKNGKTFDFLIDRITFPIQDAIGRVVGFGARRSNNKSQELYPKYLNSLESEIYKKSDLLYGLFQARKSIIKNQLVYLVEGYTDVITMHQFGATNVVATSGTCLSTTQVRQIKRLCDRVVLLRDGDEAGKKASFRDLDILIQSGINVDIISLDKDTDPDQLAREQKEGLKAYLIARAEDAIKVKCVSLYNKKASPQNKKKALELIADTLLLIKDGFIREEYVKIISKAIGVTLKTLKTEVQEWQKTMVQKSVKKNDFSDLYHFPDHISIDINDRIIEDIRKYKLFQTEDEIFSMSEKGPPYSFYSVSNFSIHIIQHMRDEKTPQKLLKAKNKQGDEAIFDIPSADFNTPQTFENRITNQGNFYWEGQRKDHERLKKYCFDKMGKGETIDIMGWQSDGFWCFNNKILKPDGEQFPITDYGVYRNGAASYYIPSANSIYRNEPRRFSAQKKVVFKESKVSIFEFMTQIMKVHREHAITGILFMIASAFQDLYAEDTKAFPILFLYGPSSTGKDQLIHSIQSLFGRSQDAISLQSGISTPKGQIREFAQFNNMISHLSEYRSGDKKMNGMLKGLWDRVGYKRGTIDSYVSNESIPILSSIILTGNDFPDEEALIVRLLWEEMTKTEFTNKEIEQYNLLKDMINKGISYFMGTIIKFRKLFEQKVETTVRKVEYELNSDLKYTTAKAKIIKNFAVVGSVYHILKDEPEINFPFNWNDIRKHFDKSLNWQMRKLQTTDLLTKWWDCFLGAVREKNDPLVYHREFRMEEDKLFIQFSLSFSKIAKSWWNIYKEAIPNKSSLSDVLKKSDAFINGKKMDYKIGSSAWIFESKKLPIHEDLLNAINWQELDGKSAGPIPISNKKNENSDISELDNIPF